MRVYNVIKLGFHVKFIGTLTIPFRPKLLHPFIVKVFLSLRDEIMAMK